MSAFGRFLARLFGRRPASPPRPHVLDDAPEVASAGALDLLVEPRSELAITPALGAAAGEAQVLAATAGVALVDGGVDVDDEREGGEARGPEALPGDGEARVVDDEDVFEEEERAEDEEPASTAGPDLDDKIAARAAAVPHLRHLAEEQALSGEHRVRPTDPSGPGTLAEALSRLEAEGRLECSLEEDADGAPILAYRPKPSVS